MEQYFAETLETAIACSGAALNSRANNFAGGVILWVAYYFDAATALRNHIPLWHGVGGVIRSLGVNVRPKLAN